MKLVLLETVQKLGEIGDVVDVRNGYARNFLIPHQKAIRANEEGLKKAEELRMAYAKQRSQIIEDFKIRAEKVAKEITIRRLCTETGHLYGSVTPADIAEGLSAQGAPVDKSEVQKSIGHIKEIGEYEIEINFHPEVVFSVRVIVVEEEGEESNRANEAGQKVDSDIDVETTPELDL
ncbi:MAG: 50S ribosomal protein L9 [Gammaproteobacteria bacterium]|nr:50S ribosomal protein L9 [Gammaproteobacteria bacterium]MCY4218629.1 50S ribosomal protein L9 [Gammaproteobacteria bacterium]MCY4275362.1 50S ribosomal protein L9 [Gammaproteobacteria bacterium]